MYEYQFSIAHHGHFVFRTEWMRSDYAHLTEKNLREGFSSGDYTITIYKRAASFAKVSTVGEE